MFTRLSGRRGNQIALDVTFLNGGVPSDPYAIYKVEIYKTQVLPHNKVATFIIASPCDDSYPSPVEQLTQDIAAGQCGTDPIIGDPIPGKYRLIWDVPADVDAPCVYYDVWTYFPTNPCLDSNFSNPTLCGDTGCPDLSESAFTDYAQRCCNRFWINADSWNCVDGLQTVRFGFEPLDQRFNQPENRPLEIGLTPLPLYDFNYNLVMPLIPSLEATIKIETMHKELLVDNADMTIGIRQGSYSTNPFVLRYNLNTSNFLIGTYKYRVTINLPDGTTRTSKEFIFTIS